MSRPADPTEHTRRLISALIDGELSETDSAELNRLLRSDPKQVEQVVDQLLLDSLLSDELGTDTLSGLVDALATPLLPGEDGPSIYPAQRQIGHVQPISLTSIRPWRRPIVISMGVVAVFAAMFVMLFEFGASSVSAATELKRLIGAQDSGLDRTYTIAIEDNPVPLRSPRQETRDDRPPKPSLDGALLHVRPPNQFVLIRYLPDGGLFLTGSNGRMSWAVRPDGPVRESADLTRFNRDLPGHEHNFPLIQIEEGLAHLQDAYSIELLPVESGVETGKDDSPTRLLVAVKKRGHRGPQRVEISYVVPTGQIRQLRFVGMPYGPEHLTVRLSLQDEQPLGASFFDHQSHHGPEHPVEEE